MKIKDKFRFTSSMIILVMFFAIIFLSIKAYGSDGSFDTSDESPSFNALIQQDISSESSNDEIDYEIYTNYKIIKVSEGDTLWDIAKKYHTKGDIRKFVLSLKKINELEDKSLKADMTLFVPYGE